MFVLVKDERSFLMMLLLESGCQQENIFPTRLNLRRRVRTGRISRLPSFVVPLSSATSADTVVLSPDLGARTRYGKAIPGLRNASRLHRTKSELGAGFGEHVSEQASTTSATKQHHE